MSELPAAAPRRPIHKRSITFQGFLREDGLWDLDCELSDTKADPFHMRERGTLPPGEPIHLLRVRLTVDDEFTVRAVASTAARTPYAECGAAAGDPMQKLVGLRMGPGWRRRIEEALGGELGCTHLRELVFNAATAAFQTIPAYREQAAGSHLPPSAGSDKPPFYMGQCMTWSFSGPVMQRVAPRFYRPKKPE